MKNLVIGILILFVFMVSCDQDMVYDQYYHIHDRVWTWDDVAKFRYESTDTTALRNILIQIRHTTEYPLSNLYLFVHVEGPSGQTMTDTINFILAEPDGKWIGRGIGKTREVSYLYRKNTRFPEKGKYVFTLEQAMRVPQLPVSEIGLRIEKANP